MITNVQAVNPYQPVVETKAHKPNPFHIGPPCSGKDCNQPWTRKVQPICSTIGVNCDSCGHYESYF